MIKVTYTKKYDYIRVSGHADSAPYGKDLICASVSCIMTGFCNHLIEKCGISKKRITIKSGYVKIDLRGKMYVDLLMELVITQLKTIEESYPNYITIKEVK